MIVCAWGAKSREVWETEVYTQSRSKTKHRKYPEGAKWSISQCKSGTGRVVRITVPLPHEAQEMRTSRAGIQDKTG